MPALRHTLLPVLLLCALATGCTDKKQSTPAGNAPSPAGAQEALSHGLTKQEAALELVKVGDTTITLGQFADRLGTQSPYLRARYASPERRREFLENMVRFELLAIEAEKRGYDKKPGVQRIRRQMMVQQMMKQMFDEKGVKLSDISDADIQSYYGAHAEEFKKPAQVRASHILVKTAAEAETLIGSLKGSADDMEEFRKRAKAQNLDENTKDRYGDLRFFAKTKSEDDGEPNVPQAVRDAAFGLTNTGDMHATPVKSEQGFHVVKLTGRRAALSRSLEDARRLIQNRLWRERREQAIESFVKELRSKADVKEDLALLDAVKVEPKGKQPKDGAKDSEGG